MAKITWNFDGTDTIDAGNTSPFSFKLERYKDSNTFEESLKISSFVNGADNGFIVTSIQDLGKDIVQLKKYGVLLSTIEFHDLQQEIENNYLTLQSVVMNLNGDTRIEELIASAIEYVDGNADLITNDLCYVPVNEFNSMAEECGFYKYEIKALRGQLKSQGYIHTSGNRLAVTVRIKDKPTRVIAFIREKLGVEILVSTKNKQTKKSDADE